MTRTHFSQKTILLILTVALVGSLTGCADIKSKISESLANRKNAETEDNTSIETPEPPQQKLEIIEIDEPVPEAEEAVQAIVPFEFLEIELCYVGCNLYGTPNDYVNADYPAIHLSDKCKEKYPNLEKKLSIINDDYQSTAQQKLDELTRIFDEDYAEDYIGLWDTYTYNNTLSVKRADSCVLCVFDKLRQYDGGTIPEYTYTVLNIDSQTGELIHLADAVFDTDALLPIIKEKMLFDYPQIDFDAFDVWDKISNQITMDTLAWGLENQGFTVWFSAQDIFGLTNDFYTITIPYEELTDVINPSYINTPNSYIISMCQNEPINIDLDGDGVLNKLTFTAEYDYNIEAYTKTSITIDENIYDFEDYSYDYDLYFVHRGIGQDFIYSYGRAENDYMVFKHYMVSDKDEVSYLQTEGNIMPFEIYENNENWYMRGSRILTDPWNMILQTRMNILGNTYSGLKTCTIAADGEPIPLQSWYDINEPHTITTLVPISVDILEETEKNGLLSYSISEMDHLLEEGTVLTVLRTDNSSFADARTEDGTLVRIYCSYSDYQCIVSGGYADTDAFTGVDYAG